MEVSYNPLKKSQSTYRFATIIIKGNDRSANGDEQCLSTDHSTFITVHILSWYTQHWLHTTLYDKTRNRQDIDKHINKYYLKGRMLFKGMQWDILLLFKKKKDVFAL